VRLSFLKPFFSCLAIFKQYNFSVPPADDFGDWATPKEPTVGHFFFALAVLLSRENTRPINPGTLPYLEGSKVEALAET